MTSILTIIIFISIVFVFLLYDRNVKLRNELNYRDKLISDQNDELKSKIGKLIESGAFDSVLSVDRFNDWFNKPKSKDVYANPGIFLRLDKLSSKNISDYIKDELHGLVVGDNFPYSKISKFEDSIRKDWLKKINSKA